ncbi:YHYH domain-containing protein [Candidatus Margulisiibacteriota bacterium]
MRNVLIVILVILFIQPVLYPHSGRTDSSGGHRNRKTGGYHYHNGGYSRPKPTYTKQKIQVKDTITLMFNNSKNVIGYKNVGGDTYNFSKKVVILKGEKVLLLSDSFVTFENKEENYYKVKTADGTILVVKSTDLTKYSSYKSTMNREYLSVADALEKKYKI